MSLARRLHLDNVISSIPELGPTVSDGGYAWMALFGISLIQMSVSGILSMYGIILGHLAEINATKVASLTEEIILTPILFSAFWSIADPWSSVIVDLANTPILIGLIGVALMSVGVIASGYLATGGVGAYLAGISAGAVMGIGASFVIVQSERILRKSFRTRLPLALTLRNVASSLGLIILPSITHLLLVHNCLKTGILLVTLVFIPTVFGALMMRAPAPQLATPYSLLRLAEEDNELPINVNADLSEEAANGLTDNSQRSTFSNINKDKEDDVRPLFEESNSIFAYQDLDEDVDVFVNPATSTTSKWKRNIQIFRFLQLWISSMTWTGMKVYCLFFFVLLPATYVIQVPSSYDKGEVILSAMAGISSLIPNIATHWISKSSVQCKRMYLACACWLGSAVLIGLNWATEYSWFLTCAFVGGMNISGLLICQESSFSALSGNKVTHRVSIAFSTMIGLNTLLFCFMPSITFCLRFIALTQFINGCYWILLCIVKRPKN